MTGYMVKGACIGIMFQAVLAAISVWTYQPYAAYAGWVSVTIGAAIGAVMGAIAYNDKA